MSQTIINDIPPYVQATATAGQTIFSTTFTANFASDVVVYQTPSGSPPNDATQILPYPSGYTVTFVGGLNQVQVTLTNPASAGDIITITRQTPANRENLYNNSNFQPSMLNNDFGILTLVDQQAQLVNQLIGPRYNYSAVITDVVDTILPILAANQIWVKNNGNTAIVALDVPSTGFAAQGATYITVTDETSFLPNSINFAGQSTGLVVFDSAGSVLTRTLAGTINQLAVTDPTGLAGNPTINIVDNPIFNGTAGIGIPEGTTAQRVTPTPPNINFRYNTDLGQMEFYDGGWVQLSDTSININPGLQNDLAYYATAGTVLSALTTANSATLVTDSSGVPSLSQTLPTAVQANITELGAQSQALNMNTHLINNVVDPVSPQDAATKNYVDQTALNGTSVYAASAATLGTVTQSGAGAGATLTNAGVQATFALDGVNPPVGSNVLIKNIATGMTAANEGIYTVTNVGSGATNWVLTRATSYDTPIEINNTGLIVILNGSTLVGEAWYNAATIVTVDTTAFNYNEFGNINFPVTVAHGGTGLTSLTAYGLMAAGTTSTGAMQQVTIGAAGTILQSGGSSALPTYTTTTYPATNAINTIMYASSANVLGVITPVNLAVMISSASGVPSMSTTLPTGISASGMVLTSPRLVTGALDVNGNNLFGFTATASAVNYFNFTNNATGFSPVIAATGSDTNIGLTLVNKGTGSLIIAGEGGSTNLAQFSSTPSAVNFIDFLNNTSGSAPAITAVGSDANITLELTGKGTGGVDIVGTGTNDNAVARQVGEFISSVIAAVSHVTMTNNTAVDLTSISLTAGDWDVWGNINFDTLGTTPQQCFCWISTSSASIPDSSLINGIALTAAGGVLSAGNGINAVQRRISIASTTTVYITGYAKATSGNATGCGGIYARRVR